jgi:SAM-dependent methyltransferase
MSPDEAPTSATAPAAAVAPGNWRTLLDLFLVSFTLLFFELTCIRWFASTVIFLTFFTNLVLMACFLGMSVGCLAASRRYSFVRCVLPLTLITVAAALGTAWAYNHYGQLAVDVGGQRSPQVVYFGTEYRAKDPSKFLIPVEAVGGVFFVLIALMFIGLGQTLGRRFNGAASRTAAYSADILGSLAGIGAFSAASYLNTTPHLWFALSASLCLYFARPWSVWQVGSTIGLLLLVAISAYGLDEPHGETFWSAYYKIHYDPIKGSINVNNLAHQDMHDMRTFEGAYSLPHELLEGIGRPPVGRMLVIGAGSGNDVAAAIKAGAGHIDAVEIDPRISRIGQEDHPNHPYDDPARVTRFFDDGRSFLRHTDKQYDLILYALVDSLVLHSGYSSLRLESFLFTKQAFADVKAKLKPGGIFVMYNYYRQGWIVARLAKMAAEAFGTQPVVISLPYQAKIEPGDSQADHFTVIIVTNGPSPVLGEIRHLLDFKPDPAAALPANGEANVQPILPRVGMAEVDTSTTHLMPTDDWPFLYLKTRAIPYKPSVTGMLLIGSLSVLILLIFAPVRRVRPNGRMFFLGAGFMLLETRGVVQMALLFGATWIVNSIVFAAILVMVLMANLTVQMFQPRRLLPFYVALAAALLVNFAVPAGAFLALGTSGPPAVLACAIVFVPVYFAGVIFSTAFRDSLQPDVDFGSNIAGIILGGLSEYLSLVIGFKWLLLVALGYYALSYVLRPKAPVIA